MRPFLARAEIYERLALQAGEADPALVVWPEAAMLCLLRLDAPIQAPRVRAVAGKANAHLLIGGVDAERGSPTGYFNSAFDVDPDRGIVAKYDRMHLVPFGQYVPFRLVLGLFVDKITQGARDYQAGGEYTVFDLGDARFAVTISYEVHFPDQVRRFIARGADVLADTTNDAWYGPSAAPYRHLSMAVFRAVEDNAYLVRAANTGISAVAQPTGRVLAASVPFKERVLVRAIRARTGCTFYARRGRLRMDFAFRRGRLHRHESMGGPQMTAILPRAGNRHSLARRRADA